ncbi:hypothetical protein CMV_006754 [Castanea mollissima]|uniref:Uncharacterized protein n=1 Tax=Castanea mollissima TaxID=60419 RepID=A0A8J4VTA8_9ROSI|nr:hypothetical protein CMV_006754 [Castanea mollissima]
MVLMKMKQIAETYNGSKIKNVVISDLLVSITLNVRPQGMLVEIIANELGNRTTPTYVVFTETHCVIGHAAKEQVAMNPTNTVFRSKRLIGKRFSDASVQHDLKLWPFKVISDPDHGRPIIVVTYKLNESVTESTAAMDSEERTQQQHLVLAHKLFLLRHLDVQDIEKVHLKDAVFAATDDKSPH